MYDVNNEKGAAMVEFALVLPLLLVLIGGIIQFGFIFNAQITLNSSVREGARHAVVGYTDVEATQKVMDSAIALMLKNIIVNVVDVTENNNVVQKKVNATGTVDVFMPFMGFLMESDEKRHIKLSAESIMRNEKTF